MVYQDDLITSGIGSISNNTLTIDGVDYLIRGLFANQDYPYSAIALDKLAPLPIYAQRVDNGKIFTFDSIYVDQLDYGYIIYRPSSNNDQIFTYNEQGKTVDVLING